MTRPRTERRAHRRFDIACPTTIIDENGRELFRAKTANLSDGGALLQPDVHAMEPGQGVHLNLRVPRQTPNTFMYEDFFSGARVIRLQPTGDGSGTATAVMFAQPLKLELEV
jgi:hypothetical protein